MAFKPPAKYQGENSVNQNPENNMLVWFHFILSTKYRKKSEPIDKLSIECRFRTGFDLALYLPPGLTL